MTELATAYQVFKRIFEDNYRIEAQTVRALANQEIPSGCLQSGDDLEATYRKKGPQGFKGYVANLSESCTPGHKLQLITQVQVAPNNQDDADLLAADLPEKMRGSLVTLYRKSIYMSSFPR